MSSNVKQDIKRLLLERPENDPYRIHATDHVDVLNGTNQRIRTDPSCKFCNPAGWPAVNRTLDEKEEEFWK